MRIGKVRLFFALICVCCIGSGAFAQTISKPIHLIVPYAAGGPIDVTARVLAELVKIGFVCLDCRRYKYQ
jgi:tripartite-type tricarboxylate transporter receptor subunit TctC